MSTEHTSKQASVYAYDIAALVAAYEADWDDMNTIKDALSIGVTAHDMRRDADAWGHLSAEVELCDDMLADLTEYGAAGWTDSDGPLEAMQDMAMCVEFRSGWLTDRSGMFADRYRITLATGGPSCHIEGDLDAHGAPCSARMYVSDWSSRGEYHLGGAQAEAALTFARVIVGEDA